MFEARTRVSVARIRVPEVKIWVSKGDEDLMEQGGDGRTDERKSPVFYRTSSPSGPLPKKQYMVNCTRALLRKFVG